MPITGFATKKLYISDAVNNRTLSGFSVSIGPVLSKQGIDILDSSNYTILSKIINSKRPDLVLIPFDQIKKQLVLKISNVQCDSLFLKLYYESTVKLQLYDTLWKYMPCDLFMIIRIHDAMSIKTFDNVHKKRIRLEAELWNCKDQETIWRIEEYAISDGKKSTDKEIMFQSIEKIYEQLPLTVPAYENGKW